MILLIVLWAVACICDGVLFARADPHDRVMAWCISVLAVYSLALSVGMSVLHWQWGLAPTIVGLYRTVNSLRFVQHRLPDPELHRVSLRAHVWLVSVQISLAAVWTLIHELSWQHLVLPIVAAAQLLVALALMRVSLRTWHHAEPFTSTTPMSDKELPTLSVLIPARNETDALERCLTRLVVSDYPKLEIIVLDDNSTNRRTSEIVRSFAQDGVRFVQGEIADEVNWLPKNQAYDHLRTEASGELLLFCGVDALFAPDTLRLLVQLLLERKKDMLSVLPLKDPSVPTRLSLLQPMRYYWEVCLPRRFFKRPPVLSTCWLIRASTLDHAGGFAAERRSVTPEAYFARQAVVTDGYSFLRSNAELGLYSNKAIAEQYDTSVRMRYPQLHRRLELIAIATLLELVLLIGPILGLVLCWLIRDSLAYAGIWLVCAACLLVTYYLVAVATKLNNPFIAWLLMPAAFVYDIFIQHVSFFKYEFSHVEWKGRNVAVSVMHVIPRLPKV